MAGAKTFEIFLVAPPGLEQALCAEAQACGFSAARVVAGGVQFTGGWREVWRANLVLRGASKVLVRIGAFHAAHVAQLDKLSRKFPWGEFLRADVPVDVEVTCRKSRIYHSGAAKQRIETAIHEEFGAPLSPEADVCIKARLDNNLCTLSLDTSGELLHKRGFKEAIGKAPMRESMAALFLRQCGYAGQEPVYDPMCGSGTFVIEAAEMALGLLPGRSRHFAFEQLVSFDAETWSALRAQYPARATTSLRFHGSDRDAGAIRMSAANAERAGVEAITDFVQRPVSDITPPAGSAGLVIVNPPYGDRIGDIRKLQGLYAALGKTLLARFSGWRVGIITSEAMLAAATGLPFMPPERSVLHGGLNVRLYQTAALP
jgi:putative N6-adenine-specific DNA methylase